MRPVLSHAALVLLFDFSWRRVSLAVLDPVWLCSFLAPFGTDSLALDAAFSGHRCCLGVK